MKKKTKKQYPYRTTFTGADGKRHDIKARDLLELADKVKKAKAKVEKNAVPSKEKKTVNDIVDEFVPERGKRDITKSKYMARANSCIVPYIGNYKVSEIKPADIQTVIDRQKGNSKTQVNEVYSLLQYIFKRAKQKGYIYIDPTLELYKPAAKDREKRRALTDAERQAVIACAAKDRRMFMFLLMLYCGCRPSEARECKGSDIIKRNGSYLLCIRGTKTKQAYRYVPIPDDLYRLISDIPDTEYIACTRTGAKIDASAYRRAWDKLKHTMNIYMGCECVNDILIPPYPLAADFVPYDLRHDYCTQLALKGVDIRDAQVLMGHSDIALTANVYTNLDREEVAIKTAKTLK